MHGSHGPAPYPPPNFYKRAEQTLHNHPRTLLKDPVSGPKQYAPAHFLVSTFSGSAPFGTVICVR